MADESIWRRLLVGLLKRLGNRSNDNAQGSKRLRIAHLYLRLGERERAAHWYMEVAKQIEWSETGMNPIEFANEALRLAPEDLEIRREHRRFLRKFGLPMPERGKPIPEKLRPGSRKNKGPSDC